MNDRWDSVSINLMEVLFASRNLFFSDSFDVIAVFKTIRDAQRTRNLLKIWGSILLFAIFRQTYDVASSGIESRPRNNRKEKNLKSK